MPSARSELQGGGLCWTGTFNGTVAEGVDMGKGPLGCGGGRKARVRGIWRDGKGETLRPSTVGGSKGSSEQLGCRCGVERSLSYRWTDGALTLP